MKINSKVVSIYNNKGGVGKTTTSKYLALDLKAEGQKVLLIDMDPQANLTRAFLDKDQYNPYKDYLSVHDLLLNDDLQVDDIKVSVDECIDIIPSNDNHSNSNNDILLNAMRKTPATRLFNKLINNNDYNMIIIDCAPTKDLLAINALTASDEVLIPITMDDYAIEGINGVLSLVETVKSEYNNRLKISGIFLNAGKTGQTYENLHNELKGALPNVVLDNKVNNYIAVSKETFNIASKNNARKQFNDIFKEADYV